MATDEEAARALDDLRRRSRRTLTIVVVGMLAIVASLVAAVFHFNSLRNEARAAEAAARQQLEINRAERNNALSDSRASQATLAQVREAIAARDFPRALALLDVAQDEVADSGRPPTQAERAAPETPPVRIDQVRRERSQLVFIQFAGSIPRERIVALNRALRSAGWRTQGASGERTEAALGVNQVRYNPADDAAAASALATAVTQAGIGSVALEAVPVEIIRRGTFEVWVSNAEADSP
jgi:hypothetical protein